MNKLLIIGSLAVCALAASCIKDENEDNINAQDKAFVREITLMNRTEILLANLALAKATDTSVRSYARLMVTDHTAAETGLNELANRVGINRPTDSLSEMASTLKPVLMGLSGRSFDSAYMVTQMSAHQAARNGTQEQINSGNNGEVRWFAQLLLPKFQTYLTMADTIAAKFR